ncbi:MAG: YvcK family protein [Kiritimatiellae bacterium]|nr:YvcK family protein [Kiritimatiellia bacterium]
MSVARRAAWRHIRTQLEHDVELALRRLAEAPQALPEAPAAARVVVLGGGTGLSTVLGGNAALSAWGEEPPVGLKRSFQQLTSGVCTTDDGGSTGELVRRLPMIGIGDTRKVLVAMMDHHALSQRYGAASPAVAIIQQVFNHRFGTRVPSGALLRDPLRVLAPALRQRCPPQLRAALAAWGQGAPAWVIDAVRVPGHCLGNLLLTLAMFRTIQTPRAPTMAEVERGLASVARAIGAPPGRVHPVTAAPGTLMVEYANGVVATGQARAARARRGCAVQRVQISFAAAPRANPALLSALRQAELIIYAPGSLYSSMLPVLLTPGVVDAIRANRRAIKLLGANLWIQEGETDRSFREQSRGFWVSELIEAYGRNCAGGIAGLFDVVVASSLEPVPGSIIRNYALEGKHPIHLDRARVARLGVLAVEARLFAEGRGQPEAMIHHDPLRFATAVRSIYDALAGRTAPIPRRTVRVAAAGQATPARPVKRGVAASARMAAIREALAHKSVRPPAVRPAIEDFLWAYPDIRPEQLNGFDGLRVVADADWRRSRQWDNVLGYYDPESRALMLHTSTQRSRPALYANLAVALGESLLGRYVAEKRWREVGDGLCRAYEIRLRPPAERGCGLSEADLLTFLKAAGMSPLKTDPLWFRRPVVKADAFLPSGILFGLLFAWMLDSAFVPALDFEMHMLSWPASRLLPYQVRKRAQWRQWIRFFREKIFCNG